MCGTAPRSDLCQLRSEAHAFPADDVATAASFGLVQAFAVRWIACQRLSGDGADFSDVRRNACDFATRQLPSAGHLGLNALGNYFAQSGIIGGMIQLRPQQAGTAATAAVLTMTQGALRFEKPLAENRITYWFRGWLRN